MRLIDRHEVYIPSVNFIIEKFIKICCFFPFTDTVPLKGRVDFGLQRGGGNPLRVEPAKLENPSSKINPNASPCTSRPDSDSGCV